MTKSKAKRVVVTGIGAVTPFGVGIPVFWDGLVNGQSAIKETEEPELSQWSPVSAELKDLDPLQYLSKKQVRNTDRITQLSLIAAQEAMEDSGVNLEGEDLRRMGITVGTGYGGVQTLGEGTVQLVNNPKKRVSPRLLSKSIPNAAASALAMQYGFQGPAMTYTTACAASANSIGEAMYMLQRGEVDLMLAGGAESLFSPVILAGLRSAGAIAMDGPEDKSAWSRPFDTNRKGMVAGEGAAFLVLETYEKAVARGATLYGELAGYGTSNDAYHETAPHPNGDGAVIAMERALDTAGLQAHNIDYVNAHATATPAGDTAESKSLQRVFGDDLAAIPVNSIKGAIGHLLGTAGAIESISCLLSMKSGILPPTLNCDQPDSDAPPNLVRERSKKQEVTSVLTNSFGFGGQNGSLIWRKV
ncbi:beta-ketoacyl synthase [Virgibacillus phasianinus]|uniref:3-oxoacyl-[acyl-carrier-protein] synthase 2 n=1 Tax=Virgibacillus phasianinus TaxID=2017483 RepID=A0A220U6D9_9BACI|nr:beta-ketoacyl-[acyl-carrier-protein] synthase family protein [Virgibacillus phasianinus]ASK63687.1 beta-ketoacyl synthase [Virgibacillus phasianinus]